MSTTTPLTITQLQERAHTQAVRGGHHEHRPSDGPGLTHYRMAQLSLMHKQLSDVFQELWRGEALAENYYPAMDTHDSGEHPYRAPGTGGYGKPYGVPAACADLLILLLDFCGQEGIDLEAAMRERMALNAGNAPVHGWKLS